MDKESRRPGSMRDLEKRFSPKELADIRDAADQDARKIRRPAKKQLAEDPVLKEFWEKDLGADIRAAGVDLKALVVQPFTGGTRSTPPRSPAPRPRRPRR
jgi:hypothetical protein